MENDRIWTLLTRKLSGEATPTELQELDRLITLYPESKKTITSLSQSWVSGITTDTEFLEATYLQHLERMKAKGFSLNSDEQLLIEENTISPKPAGKPSVIKQILIYAIVLTLIAATWVIIRKPAEVIGDEKKDETGLVTTNNGSRTKLLLPDGSSVWLNAGSKLTYNKKFNAASREVYLTGEAFFDVVKDPQRPFLIHTSKMDVKVLGTQFNVKAYEQDKTFETSLIHGSVEVFLKKDQGKKYLLKPNQKLVLTNKDGSQQNKNFKPGIDAKGPLVQIKELTYINGTNNDVESSWTRNILSFEDESFSEVSKKMERWYDVKFEFNNKRWENEFLSGSFEKESLDQAMSALKFTAGFDFSIKDKIITIY